MQSNTSQSIFVAVVSPDYGIGSITYANSRHCIIMTIIIYNNRTGAFDYPIPAINFCDSDSSNLGHAPSLIQLDYDIIEKLLDKIKNEHTYTNTN